MKLSDKDYYEAHTKMTGNKGSRVVTAEETLNIEELGLNMQVKATSTEQKVAVSTALNATNIEDFTAGLEEIVNRYTVVTGVEITPVDEETAEYVTHVSFCGHPSQNVGYGDLKYIGQKYSIVADDAANLLPGLSVTVNGTQVSLSYNGQSAVVTGVLSEDLIGHEKVFIAVRDLAQVGIDVSYSANPEVLTLSVK